MSELVLDITNDYGVAVARTYLTIVHLQLNGAEMKRFCGR